MAKKTNYQIEKSDWISSFTLIGKPKISDYTFDIDAQSNSSSYVYNRMRLNVDCGTTCGTVQCEMMGGYFEEQPSKIYVHGKNEDGTDNFDKKVTVDWEDRLDEDVLSQIGDRSFLVVGLKRTTKGKRFDQKFLSPYDAIAYIKDNLNDEMTIRVSGRLSYSMYQGNVQVRKNVTSITLYDKTDPSEYTAKFTQTMLLDKNSIDPNAIDTTNNIAHLDVRILDYLKEFNGKEVKGQFPFAKQVELPFKDMNAFKAMCQVGLKVKKNITQATFDGLLIEGGAVVKATWDDVPPNIRVLVDAGWYTREQAMALCSASSGRELRFSITNISVDRQENGDLMIATPRIYPDRYTEEDLVLPCMMDEDEVSEENIATNDAVSSASAVDTSWLNNI